LGIAGLATLSGLAYNDIIPNPVYDSDASSESRLSDLFGALSFGGYVYSYTDGVVSTYRLNRQKRILLAQQEGERQAIARAQDAERQRLAKAEVDAEWERTRPEREERQRIARAEEAERQARLQEEERQAKAREAERQRIAAEKARQAKEAEKSRIAEYNRKNTSSWEIRYFVDKFDNFTDEAYITTRITGTFGNSTTNSLVVRLIITKDNFAFELYEHGISQVRNIFDMNQVYEVFIQDGEKNRYNTVATLRSNQFFPDNRNNIYNILLKGGLVKFVVERKSLNSYKFDIEDTQGFAAAYYALFGGTLDERGLLNNPPAPSEY
jgi:hypothetical protein